MPHQTHNAKRAWEVAREYDYTDSLPGRDWAWEFLRRNAAFQEVWAEMSNRFDYAYFDDQHTVVRPTGDIEPLKRWGCLFVDQVDARSTAAGVIWRPKLVADVAHLHAIPDSLTSDVEPFDFNRVTYRTVVFDAPDGRQHLLFHDDVQSLQLSVQGDILRPCHLVPDIVAGKRQTKQALKALHCFNELRVTGKLNAQYCIPGPRAPRLRVVLQALDGALSGATYQEIAVVLFGAEHVAADWNDPGRHMLDRVRRAVRRGRELMNGGYLKFLA
jgi:hypothetical protein